MRHASLGTTRRERILAAMGPVSVAADAMSTIAQGIDSVEGLEPYAESIKIAAALLRETFEAMQLDFFSRNPANN